MLLDATMQEDEEKDINTMQSWKKKHMTEKLGVTIKRTCLRAENTMNQFMYKILS